MPDQVGHDVRNQVGQDALEIKRNFSLHEEDRLAGDEDALTS